MAYNIEELKAKYGYTQPTSQTDGSYDIEALKKKYAPVQSAPINIAPQPTPYQAPVSPLKGFAGTVDNMLNPLVNAGEGAGLSVANTVFGLAGGAAKLVGAKKLSQGIEDARQQAFVKPTENSQKTFAGKAGKTITDVAQYMAPVGGVAKVSKFALPAGEIAKDTLVGYGQSNGDVGAGAVSGVTSALTGGLSNIPMAKNVIVRTGQKLLPGYTSDVVNNIASGKEGADIIAPGYGTLFSAGLNTGIGGVKMYKNVRNPQTHLNAMAKDFDVPDKVKNSKFDNAKEIKARAISKGHDVLTDIAESKIIKKEHIVGGKYDTAGVADKVRTEAGQGSAYLDEATKLADQKVLHEPSMDLYEKAVKNVDGTTVEGAAIIKRIRKEASLQKNTFGFNDVYNKKKYYGSKSHWKMGMPGDGIAEQANAEINKVLKDKLLEQGKKTGVPVEDFLKMQENKYLTADYLDALDGAPVPKTPIQKVRGLALRGAGAIFGSKGGLMGSVGGYHTGAGIDNLIGQIPTPFRASVLQDYQRATPTAQKKMLEVIQKMVDDNKGVKLLSGKNTIFPKMDTSGFDRKATEELTKNINEQSIKNELLKQKRLPAPKPLISNPLNKNQSYVGGYEGQDINKIKKDTGGYLPVNKSSINIPMKKPRIAITKKAITNRLPRKK